MILANNPRRILQKLFGDSRGANMVEYIILVGVVALLAIVAFRFFGKSVSSKIAQQADSVSGVESNK